MQYSIVCSYLFASLFWFYRGKNKVSLSTPTNQTACRGDMERLVRASLLKDPRLHTYSISAPVLLQLNNLSILLTMSDVIYLACPDVCGLIISFPGRRGLLLFISLTDGPRTLKLDL